MSRHVVLHRFLHRSLEQEKEHGTWWELGHRSPKQTQTTEFTDLRPTSLPTDWSLVGATADLMLPILEPLRRGVPPPRDRGWGSHTVVAVAGRGRAGRSVACHDEEEEEDANPRRAGEGDLGDDFGMTAIALRCGRVGAAVVYYAEDAPRRGWKVGATMEGGGR